MRVLVVAALLVVLAPGAARAADASLVARELPVAPARASAVATAPARFDLVGLHWQGSGTVRFRTQGIDGRWSRWRPAAPEPEDRPDRARAEAVRTRGWKLGNPYWTGPSDRIQYRLVGSVRRLRAYFVRSPAAHSPMRGVSLAGSPGILSRSAWGANEGIRRSRPAYADAVRFALVHHTAGSNSYGPGQSAAIVRAIETYHVEGNGWNDIGYNFLVDKYGQVFEGRYGGVDRAVVGAHAQGFNWGSVGVAVLGDYSSAPISAAAAAALVRLLAWRLDVAHVDPLSTVTAVSNGNPRFPAGTPVRLRAISGHRDTGPTACPGNGLYAQLNGIAHSVATTGLPKIYSPVVHGDVGGVVRFTARLSNALPWTVTVMDAGGQTVAAGVGIGTNVEWSWDATTVLPGRYTYAIDATFGARPVTGTLGPLAPLTLTDVSMTPRTVTPNGDGRGDTARLRYRLGAAARVTATLTDAAGATLATLFVGNRLAGRHSFNVNELAVPDGRYRLVLDARASGDRKASATAEFLVDRTLAGFGAEPGAFSPNGDGRADAVTFVFALAVPAQVTLRVERSGSSPSVLLSGPLQPGQQRIGWDGGGSAGRFPDGRYKAVVDATDALTTVSQSTQLVLDTVRPRLRLLSARRLLFWLSEPATVRLVVDGAQVVKLERAGRFHVPHRGTARRISAIAVDAAGNQSATVQRP